MTDDTDADMGGAGDGRQSSVTMSNNAGGPSSGDAQGSGGAPGGGTSVGDIDNII